MKYAFLLLFSMASVQAEIKSVDDQSEQLKAGLVLIQEKKYSQAEAYFQKLKTQYPDQIPYLNNLAVAQMAQGKTENALENLKIATVSDQYFSVMQKNISDIYAYMASQAYSQALEKKRATLLPELASISSVKLTPEKKITNEVKAELLTVDKKENEVALNEVLEKQAVAWVDAWMNGDIKQYISFYSKDFIPADKLSYQEWAQQRRYRLRQSKQVSISFNQLTVFFDAEKNTAITEFVQQYKAGAYQDKVRKQLYWKIENESWLILREQVVEAL